MPELVNAAIKAFTALKENPSRAGARLDDWSRRVLRDRGLPYGLARRGADFSSKERARGARRAPSVVVGDVAHGAVATC